MSKYQVLYVTKSEFQDRITGRLVQSLKVQYASPDAVNTDNAKGLPALTVPAEFSLWSQFRQVPGAYDLEFASIPDGRGRPQQTITGVKLQA
ncbi:hypothetical protein MYO_830 (plasmid) [Synechocystis sp. PCC 6803]|jgi:hypothetical protein|uniref:hypothetical protein n=1 Tax=Bacteria TaxID=2 RepID=UPI00000B4B73|nr:MULTISPECIES: hypothetical protein [Bacteria]AAA97420.1 orf3 [Synechocystis sp. PCC 6803]AGF53823.1 hypothetical protein MYO_830 [Synechocystis sp. PCC 6803]AVP91411.1 hypothetical protein C7I86_16680 [Synechocystis sp. IPPAS B-1465]